MQMIDPDTVRYSIQVTLLLLDQKNTAEMVAQTIAIGGVFIYKV